MAIYCVVPGGIEALVHPKRVSARHRRRAICACVAVKYYRVWKTALVCWEQFWIVKPELIKIWEMGVAVWHAAFEGPDYLAVALLAL